MKYQLVLQAQSSSRETFEDMVALEERLSGVLGDLGVVDGHDVGSGEVNIFILTDRPTAAFELIRREMPEVLSPLRVAYRHLDSDEFSVLYPAGLRAFVVK